MRGPCQKQRKTTPDRFFCDMVRNCAYSWLEGYVSPYNQPLDEEDDDDNYGFDEEEGYEDDLTRAQRGAGFYMDDDGECQYVDDYDEDEDEEDYEDNDRW